MGGAAVSIRHFIVLVLKEAAVQRRGGGSSRTIDIPRNIYCFKLTREIYRVTTKEIY